MDRTEDWITCCHTLKVLRRSGIETMEQLSGFSREDLLRLRGVGPVIANDLAERIAAWSNAAREARPAAGTADGRAPDAE